MEETGATTTLTREQVLLGRAVSSDTTRGSLCCVHVTNEKLQACDGHMLVEADAPESVPEGIQGDYAGKAWGKMKQASKHSPTVVTRVNGCLHANPCKPDKLTVIERKDNVGPFPNTEAIRATGPVLVTVPLVAKTLKKLLSALDPDAVIRFEVHTSHVAGSVLTKALPFTVVGSESNVRGLIMPGRLTK